MTKQTPFTQFFGESLRTGGAFLLPAQTPGNFSGAVRLVLRSFPVGGRSELRALGRVQGRRVARLLVSRDPGLTGDNRFEVLHAVAEGVSLLLQTVESLLEAPEPLFDLSGGGAEFTVLGFEFEPFLIPSKQDPQDGNGKDHDDRNEGNQGHGLRRIGQVAPPKYMPICRLLLRAESRIQERRRPTPTLDWILQGSTAGSPDAKVPLRTT